MGKLIFFGLPLVIVRQILDRLENDELDTFRLVSRACRSLSEPIMFQTLTLHDRTRSRKVLEVTQYFYERLQNAKDELRHSVRHLIIGPFKHERLRPTAQALKDMLHNIQDLRDFSWNVRSEMPEDVLSILTTKWPDLWLHVTNLEREHAGTTAPVDTRLLSSTQLHSLNYRVSCSNDRSEIDSLKACLLRGKRLKRLHLSVRGADRRDMNFDFQDGEDFPTLVKLSLEESYALTETHCRKWLTAMDWSRLRHLAFDCGIPRHLLSVLTGQIPQLKILVFRFTYYQGPSYWSDLTAVQTFLDSVDGLEQMVVSNWDSSEFNQVYEFLLQRHGHTLNKLHIETGGDRGWNLESVRLLTKHCPHLRDLRLKVAMHRPVQEALPREHNTCWPDLAIAEIIKLPRLRNLEVEIPLDEFSHEFVAKSESYHMVLVDTAAQNRATTLFNQLCKSHQPSTIESVKVIFTRTYSRATWQFTVKRRFGTELGFLVEKTSSGTEDQWYDPFG